MRLFSLSSCISAVCFCVSIFFGQQPFPTICNDSPLLLLVLILLYDPVPVISSNQPTFRESIFRLNKTFWFHTQCEAPILSQEHPDCHPVLFLCGWVSEWVAFNSRSNHLYWVLCLATHHWQIIWSSKTFLFWHLNSSDSHPRTRQVRLVSVEAEHRNHPSRRGGSSRGGGPPRQRRRRRTRDSIRPFRLTVALGLTTGTLTKKGRCGSNFHGICQDSESLQFKVYRM